MHTRMVLHIPIARLCDVPALRTTTSLVHSITFLFGMADTVIRLTMHVQQLAVCFHICGL